MIQCVSSTLQSVHNEFYMKKLDGKNFALRVP